MLENNHKGKDKPRSSDLEAFLTQILEHWIKRVDRSYSSFSPPSFPIFSNSGELSAKVRIPGLSEGSSPTGLEEGPGAVARVAREGGWGWVAAGVRMATSGGQRSTTVGVEVAWVRVNSGGGRQTAWMLDGLWWR